MATYAVTFDSDKWTFDDTTTLTFDMDGVNISVTVFDSYARVTTNLVNGVDSVASVGNETSTATDTSSQISSSIQSIVDTLTRITSEIVTDFDTKLISWVVLPDGTALALILGANKVYLSAYFSAQSGELSLYQAQEISTGGDKFGYPILNYDDRENVSLVLSSGEYDDLLAFFDNAADGMNNSFAVLDNISLTLKTQRFNQNSIQFTEQDGLYHTTIELLKA